MAKDLVKIHDNYTNLLKTLTQSTLPQTNPNPPIFFVPPPMNEPIMPPRISINETPAYAGYAMNQSRIYGPKAIQDPISQIINIPMGTCNSLIQDKTRQNQIPADLVVRAIQQIVFSPIAFKEEIIERIL